jgi:hypothetical protein
MTQARDLADGKFDTDTLVVDAANNRVGVGTTTVDSALHIEQNASGVTETSGSTVKVHNINSSGRSKISVHNHAETASGSMYYDTDSGMLALQGDTGAGVVFHTNGNNERGRWLVGGGLTFNGDTAAANALDDYEEGVHQTTITCGTSGTITLTAAGDDLSYTKIGNMVNVRGMLQVTSVSSPVGTIQFSLPFTVAGGAFAYRQAFEVFVFNSSSNVSDFVGVLYEGNSTAVIFLGDAIGAQSDSANSLSGNEEIYISATFRV